MTLAPVDCPLTDYQGTHPEVEGACIYCSYNALQVAPECAEEPAFAEPWEARIGLTPADLQLARDLGRALTQYKLWTPGMPVVEAGESGMTGVRGITVVGPTGGTSVRWSGGTLPEDSWLQTSLTHGTVPAVDDLTLLRPILGILCNAQQALPPNNGSNNGQ